MREAIDVRATSGGLRFVGSRDSARALRERLRVLLTRSDEVVLDFSGVSVGQSFIDELIGVLLVQESPEILGKLIFKACDDGVRAAIEYVVADRYDEFVRRHSH